MGTGWTTGKNGLPCGRRRRLRPRRRHTQSGLWEDYDDDDDDDCVGLAWMAFTLPCCSRFLVFLRWVNQTYDICFVIYCHNAVAIVHIYCMYLCCLWLCSACLPSIFMLFFVLTTTTTTETGSTVIIYEAQHLYLQHPLHDDVHNFGHSWARSASRGGDMMDREL